MITIHQAQNLWVRFRLFDSAFLRHAIVVFIVVCIPLLQRNRRMPVLQLQDYIGQSLFFLYHVCLIKNLILIQLKIFT